MAPVKPPATNKSKMDNYYTRRLLRDVVKKPRSFAVKKHGALDLVQQLGLPIVNTNANRNRQKLVAQLRSGRHGQLRASTVERHGLEAVLEELQITPVDKHSLAQQRRAAYLSSLKRGLIARPRMSTILHYGLEDVVQELGLEVLPLQQAKPVSITLDAWRKTA